MSDKKTPDYIKEGEGFADITLAGKTVIGGAEVSTIRMREPDVGDLEVATESGASSAKSEITLFANLCEVAPADIRKLKLRNYARLQAAYSLFTN